MGTKLQVTLHMSEKMGPTSLERATERKGVKQWGPLENQPDHRARAAMRHTRGRGQAVVLYSLSLFLSLPLSRPVLHSDFLFISFLIQYHDIDSRSGI